MKRSPTRLPPTRRMLAAAVVAAGVTLAACSGDDGGAVDTTAVPTTSATTTTQTPGTTAPATTAPAATQPATTVAETTTTTTIPPIPRQPLTGQPLASTAEIVNRPALVVKIDNASSARRNHSGLQHADIVFEEMVEGRITRFAAVFHSRDSDPVGPIRSGRTQDVDLLTALRQPLFAWSGGNPGVTRAIAESTFVDLNWQKTPNTYYRGAGSVPHNLYSSTPRLWQHVPFGHPGAPPQQFHYLADDQAFQGDPVTGVDVGIGSVDIAWDWAPELGTFVRSQNGTPHFDVVNGLINATNVVLMVVEYQPSRVDTRSPEAQTLGNGPAYILSDGKAIEGRWVRETADQPISLEIEGTRQVIPINPGNTWVELVEAIEGGPDEAHPGADITFR